MVNEITYLTLDVVEGEHAVGVSALSLDRGGTLAGSGRAESGAHDADWSSESSCRRSRDAVPVPGIHRTVRRLSPCFLRVFRTWLAPSPKRMNTHSHVTFSRFSSLPFRLLCRDLHDTRCATHTSPPMVSLHRGRYRAVSSRYTARSRTTLRVRPARQLALARHARNDHWHSRTRTDALP